MLKSVDILCRALLRLEVKFSMMFFPNKYLSIVCQSLSENSVINALTVDILTLILRHNISLDLNIYSIQGKLFSKIQCANAFSMTFSLLRRCDVLLFLITSFT